MNKRRFTRVDFQAKVVVCSKDTRTEGETRNVSLRGMYLQNFLAVPLGEEVEIEISIPDAPGGKALKTKAIAVRQQDGGTGFQFGTMDFDAFFALQEIVARLSGTPGQVMTEVMSFVNNG
jgi:hypothetical protein